MNIKGIELLRETGLPGPRKEIISKGITEIDIDDLYCGADLGATIMVFDYLEKINQAPHLEKQVRKYKVNLADFEKTFFMLKKEMLKKGVKNENLRFVTYQTYTIENIAFSGRITVNDNNIFIEAVESLRLNKTPFDFTSFAYFCPIKAGRIFRSQGQTLINKIGFPSNLLSQLVISVAKLYILNPNIDFEVYSNNGKIFYHDMFLDIN